MNELEPSPQQIEIINAFKAGKSFKIEALAGTGKTSTLILLSKSTNKKGLYLAFNKRIAKESESKFPNVTVKTVHSLAYRWALSKFRQSKLVNPLTQRNISEYLLSKTGKSEKRINEAIFQTLKNFWWSSESVICDKHLPKANGTYSWIEMLEHEERSEIVELATDLWGTALDQHSDLSLGHDGYLKAWAETQPKIAMDYILVDEAQDLNEVMYQIISSLNLQTVIVGDRFQQIYEWRGASNFLKKFSALETYPLETTYRFNRPISNLANLILYLSGSKHFLTSRVKHNSNIYEAVDTEWLINAELCRKNSTLIGLMINKRNAGRDYYLVDPNKRITHLIEDYERLLDGKAARSDFLRGFRDWEEVLDFAANGNDELQAFVNLVSPYTPPDLIELIECSVDSTDSIHLSNIHQAKGLEWDNVSIVNDFSINFDDLSSSLRTNVEEARLLYVALTRARERLFIPIEMVNSFSSNLRLLQNDI